MEVYEKIRDIRERKHFTQEYVATKLGITQKAYSKIESGETKIYEQKIVQIAEALEVPPGLFFEPLEKFTYNNYSVHNGDGLVYRKTSDEKIIEEIIKLNEKFDKIIEVLINKIA